MNTSKKNPKRDARSARDARQQVLAQWRGIDLQDEETARGLTAKAVKNVMPNVLAQLGLEKRRAHVEILKVWNHLLDPAIVAHAQPTGLRQGTLFVTVDSSVWLNEIVRFRRREILERLQYSFGRDLITRLSFRVG